MKLFAKLIILLISFATISFADIGEVKDKFFSSIENFLDGSFEHTDFTLKSTEETKPEFKKDDFFKIIIDFPRSKLIEKINARSLQMLENGAISEVKKFLKLKVSKNKSISKKYVLHGPSYMPKNTFALPHVHFIYSVAKHADTRNVHVAMLGQEIWIFCKIFRGVAMTLEPCIWSEVVTLTSFLSAGSAQPAELMLLGRTREPQVLVELIQVSTNIPHRKTHTPSNQLPSHFGLPAAFWPLLIIRIQFCKSSFIKLGALESKSFKKLWQCFMFDCG